MVSVVIPVYKTEKYLEAAVNSVLNQTYKDIEIILVDDGSPDKCPQLCDELSKKHDCIRVVHKENGGLSSARNVGIEKATGEYLYFLDSDDTIIDCAIEDMVKIAKKENSDAVLPNAYYKVYEDSNRKEIAYHFTEDMFEKNPVDYLLNILLGKARGQRTTAVLFKKNVIVDYEVKFPIGLIAEDFFFMLDFMSIANNLSVYTKPSLLNLKRLGSLSGAFQSGFENTIWLMDERVMACLKKVGKDNKDSFKKVDALLCRNIVTYLFSIMSAINPMPYKQKKKLAKEVLYHIKTRDVWKQSHPIPYFQNKVTELAFVIVYKLLRFRLINIALFVMSCIKKKGR